MSKTELEDFMITVQVSVKQIADLRMLKPDFKVLSSSSIVKLALERWIDELTVGEKP